MPETVGGIPVHPLIVHGVVVLIPLAAIGVILIAFSRPWRIRFAGLVAILALLPTLMIPVATESGESLEEAVGESAALETHAELGDAMLFFAIPLLVVAVALWWVGRRERQKRPYGRGLTITLGIVSVIVAAAAGFMVIRVGHTGADAAWGDVVASEGG